VNRQERHERRGRKENPEKPSIGARISKPESMRRFAAAFFAEALKARRSLVPWLVGVFTAFIPVMLGVMMAIKKHPLAAQRFGLLTEKSRLLAGAADWPTFLGLIGQVMGAVGGIAFAIVTAWVFGREFVDRTCRLMLATPTKRSVIVSAKLAVSAMWCFLLAAWMVTIGFVAGAVVGMPGLSWRLTGASLAIAGRAALLFLVLQPVTAFVASLGRGYLLPIGLALIAMILAQFVGATGWAAWFPWTVAMFSGTPDAHPGGISILLVILTGAAGAAATMLWWERADQTW
jgi:ABC-2 type transport system permease protein